MDHNLDLGRLWAGTEDSLQELERRLAALTPQVLAAAREQWSLRRADGHSDSQDSQQPQSRLSARYGATGVVRIQGAMVEGGDPWFNEMMGLTGYDEIREALLEMALDDSVSSILLDINSGGGQVGTMSEVADLVASIDKTIKPVYTHTSGKMCSAAYYVGCAARRMTAATMADVGSIGILLVQRSVVRSLAENGVDVKVIRAGEFKAMGNPFEALSEKAKKVLQDSCDYAYGLFLDHVAACRKVSLETARNRMGEGRVFMGAQALEAGLVDAISSFDEALTGATVAKKPNFLQYGSHSTQNNNHNASTTMTHKINPLLAAARVAAVKAAADKQAADDAANKSADTQPDAAGDATNPTVVVADANLASPAAPNATVTVTADTKQAQAALDAVELVTLRAQNGVLKEQLEQVQAKLLEAQVSITRAQEQSGKEAESVKGLRAIAGASLDHLTIALGGSAGASTGLSDAQLVAQHALASEKFDANFKAGGVAVLSSKKPEPERVDPMRAARLKAARLT